MSLTRLGSFGRTKWSFLYSWVWRIADTKTTFMSRKSCVTNCFLSAFECQSLFSKATCRFREQWLAMLLHSSKIGFLLHPDICKESTKFHFQVKTNSWKHRRQSQLKINIEQGLLTRPCKGLLSLAYSQNLKCYYSPFYEWSLMRSK